MIFKRILYFFIFSWANFSFATSSYIIKDSVTQEVLPYAEIQIQYLNPLQDTLISYITSDTEGKFNIPEFTIISITITYLGYESLTLKLLPENGSIIYLKPNTFSLDEVVITGTFIPVELKESVYDIKSIDGKTIDSKAIVHIGEALNRELSFKTNNGHVNETAIMMNGLSGNHVKLLIDGVPVEGRLNGNIDLSQINISNIERIEVVDGPSSVAYGTNALGGTINIITKKYQVHKWSASIRAYYESIGQYNLDGTIGFRNKNNQYKISVGRHYFDGYSMTDTSRLKTWKPREQTFGTLLYTRSIHLIQLSFINEGFYEKMISRGITNPPYHTTAFDTYYTTSRYSSKVLLSGKVTPYHYLDGTFSYSYFGRLRNIYYKDLTTLTYYPTDGESDQDTTRYHALLFRGIFTQKKDSSVFNYQAGIDVKSDFISAQRIYNKRQALHDVSLLGSIDYKPLDIIVLKPALRISYNSAYNFSVTPSIHILVRPTKDIGIKFSYARGFRAPELKELYLEFHYNSTINLYGNTALRPESSNHVQCNLDIDKIWLNHHLKMNYKLYYSTIKNRIGLQQISAIDWKYFNSDEFTVFGVNTNFNYQYEFFKINLGYNCNATYNAYFDKLIASNKVFYNHTLVLSTTVKYPKWNIALDVDYKYNGKIQSYYLTDNQDIINSNIGDYHVVDLSMNKYFLKEKLQCIVGVKNLTNTRQVSFVGDIYGVSNQSDATTLNVQWGRSFFTALIFKI